MVYCANRGDSGSSALLTCPQLLLRDAVAQSWLFVIAFLDGCSNHAAEFYLRNTTVFEGKCSTFGKRLPGAYDNSSRNNRGFHPKLDTTRVSLTGSH